MSEKAEYIIKLKDEMSAGLAKIEGRLDKFEGKLKETSGKTLPGMERSIKAIGTAVAGAFAIERLAAFGMESIRTAAKMESMRNAIVFASGSAEEGGKNLEFLRSISERLGFDLASTTEGFKTFSGALIGSEFEGARGRKIFEQLSTGISAMGLSADDAKGAFLAIGQMISKGTVSAEELRGQLGERLPGAFTIAARSMGVTTAQLGKMLKDGDVVTSEFLPNFAKEIEKTFIGGVGEASRSMNANMNRISNKWEGFKNDVGRKFAPAINLLANGFESVTEKAMRHGERMQMLRHNIAPLIDRYEELSKLTNRSASENEELKNIVQEISRVMPSAVSAWNSYGQAVSISTEKVKANIKYSEDALKVMNKAAIQETMSEIRAKKTKLESLRAVLNRGEISQDIGMGQRTTLKIDDQMASEMRGEIELLAQSLKELNDTYHNLQGKRSLSQREEELMKGLAERDAMLKGMFKTPEEAKPMAAMVSGKSGGSVGVEKIQSATRNITINIKEINMMRQNDNLTDMQLKERITKILVDAVNDVNLIAQ